MDMQNTKKSFKGKPTTNVMTGNVSRKNAAAFPLNYGTHANIARTTEIVYYSAKRPNVLKYYSTNNTGYAMLNNQFSIENQSGTVYSYSYDYLIVRGSTANPFAPTIYGNGYKNPTGSNTGTNRTTTDTLLDDGWTRRTTTYTAGHTGYNYLRVNLSTTGTGTLITDNNNEGDFEILFDNFQMESGVPSPFTETSRSNTQAIFDLSKSNKTITATNLSYNSDNTFEFDGTDDKIINDDNCGLTSSITLEACFKSTSSGGIHRTLICTDTGYQYGAKLMNFKNNNRWGIWLGFGSSNYEAFYSENINDSNVHVLTASWNQSTGKVRLYKDGEWVTNISTGQTSDIVLNDGKITIGTEYHGGTHFTGEIYDTKIYNRVLSDDEVKQNFEALRGRFGI